MEDIVVASIHMNVYILMNFQFKSFTTKTDGCINIQTDKPYRHIEKIKIKIK